MGIVLRSQLVVLLRTRRCFQPTPFVSEVRAGEAAAGGSVGTRGVSCDCVDGRCVPWRIDNPGRE
jgi:hypothetical protein